MYGCGIGPIYKKFNQKVAAAVLNANVEIITLRDSNSREVLQKMGVTSPRILLTADPTVNIGKAGSTAVARAFIREGVPPDLPKIGFCLRNWPLFLNPEYLAEAADYAYSQYGFYPVFIPIELPKDIEAARKVTSLMKAPFYTCQTRHEVEELIGMLGSMKLVIGMRLHSLIFATMGGAPVIGVSYDIKVDSFIHDIGADTCIPLRQLSAEKLKRQIDLIAETGFCQVPEAAARLRMGEQINIDSVKELLTKKS